MSYLAKQKPPETVENYKLTVDRSSGVISRYVENLKKILGKDGVSGFINETNYPVAKGKGPRVETVEFEVHSANKFCYSDGTVDYERVKRNKEMLAFPDPAEALLLLTEVIRLGRDDHLYLAFLSGQNPGSQDLLYLDRRQVRESFRITTIRGFYSKVVLVKR